MDDDDGEFPRDNIPKQIFGSLGKCFFGWPFRYTFVFVQQRQLLRFALSHDAKVSQLCVVNQVFDS